MNFIPDEYTRKMYFSASDTGGSVDKIRFDYYQQ